MTSPQTHALQPLPHYRANRPSPFSKNLEKSGEPFQRVLRLNGHGTVFQAGGWILQPQVFSGPQVWTPRAKSRVNLFEYATSSRQECPMSRNHTDRLAALMNEAVLVAGRTGTGAGSGEPWPRHPGDMAGKQDPSFSPGSPATMAGQQAGTGSSVQYCSTLRPQIWARLVLASCLGARS